LIVITVCAEENAIEYAKEMSIKEIAKNLLQQNVDINVIIKSTGLTNEEIQNLLTEVKQIKE
jgi:hypothetical protein